MVSNILTGARATRGTRETLLEVLPVRHEKVIETESRQNTADIRSELLAAHSDYAKDYDLISHYFDTGNIVDTSRQIFEFLKANVPYAKESGKYQTIKNPRAILLFNDGSTVYNCVDCKNYSSFIAGLISSIKRNNPGANSDWDWCYRFASYDERDPEPGHVFVVVKIGDKELWIDPVFKYFNDGDLHYWELDEKPVKSIGGLYRVIAGPNDQPQGTVVVDGARAWSSFLFFVQQNIFSIRTLLVQYPDITMGQLKHWCVTNGYDFQQLLNFINYSV